MKLIRVFALAVFAVFGAQTAAHAQTCGSENIGSGNGCYEATHPAYIIFGATDGLSNVAKTIAYKGGTLSAPGSAGESNVDVNSSGTLLSGSTNAIAFVQDATLDLRANAASTVTISVPMLSDGSTNCTPAFGADGSGSSQLNNVGVVANFTITITADDSDSNSPSTIYTISASGGSVMSESTGIDVSCPASAGVGTGTIEFALDPDSTTEYEVEFDIGFETDGSKGAWSSSSNEFETVGADGEPAADVYEMTLGVAVATTESVIS